MDSVGPQLAAARVRLAEKGIAEHYWASFVETVESGLRELETR